MGLYDTSQAHSPSDLRAPAEPQLPLDYCQGIDGSEIGKTTRPVFTSAKRGAHISVPLVLIDGPVDLAYCLVVRLGFSSSWVNAQLS